MRHAIYKTMTAAVIVWTVINAGFALWAIATIPTETAALGFGEDVARDALVANISITATTWAVVAIPLLLAALLIKPARQKRRAERLEPRL